MKKIALTTKEELNIYMSPVRQQLLRQLSIATDSMTPKMLADKLQISPSSVKHHIKKLMLLGLIELDHTEMINGIKARFYKLAQVTVQICLSQSDDLEEQREVLVQDLIAQVYDGFRKQMSKRICQQGEKNLDALQKWGDIMTGVVHLSSQQSQELLKLVTEYIEQHASPTVDSSPWEYAIIAYNAQEMYDE